MNRVETSDFDIYISEWEIYTSPVDYLFDFFHSSNVSGVNYPGYRNESFDIIIEHARTTGDENERLQDIMDAQTAIPYDLPYDVLYYGITIDAYRFDRFTGWSVDISGLYNKASIYSIKKPVPYDPTITFDIPVQPGWNFISVPLVQEDTLILEVLDDDGGDTTWDCAQWYDGSDKGWDSYLKGRPSSLNDLNDINHTMGFLVNITDVGSDGNLTVRGALPSSMDIILYEGWNMVGYPAIDDSIVTVGDVKASTGNYVTSIENHTFEPYNDSYILKRGEGYWFNVFSNCTWHIENIYIVHEPIRINFNADFDEA
ncbi:MAG: hypothetical protein KAX31_00340, partial [Thermoplasmata archaeon]|nr:hypothetical protein [Thermoplasmata archaeon]